MFLPRPFIAIFVFLCIYAIPNSTTAQSRINASGNGGIHTIQGRIYTPSGKMIDNTISVKLESNAFGELSLITDQNGGFVFKALLPGTYYVVVNAGENFEIARESVTIDPQIQGAVPMRDQPRVFTVPVNLQLKRNADQKKGVINAKLSDVPKDAIKHYEKGAALGQEGKNDEALIEFKQAIATYPVLAQAHVEMGKIYLKSGKFDDALASFRLALQIDPLEIEAKLDYGIALYAKGELDEAEKALKNVAEVNRAAVTPHYYLGLLYIQRKSLDLAQTELEAAKQLKGDRNFPLLHRYLGGIYVTKNLNKLAIAELEIYISLVPDAQDAERIRRTITDLKSKSN